MNKLTRIPQEWQMLVECLRCALHDQSPPETIESADWAMLLRQARGHSVECFLFPWLCKYLPSQFSAQAVEAQNSPQAAWRAIALKHLNTTLIRQQQATEILKALASAGVEVVPLKGTWLSETIYKEASQRQMADIDLLVGKNDKTKAGEISKRLGYTPKREMSDSEYMCDLSFYHPTHIIFVELHWNVECQMAGARGIPDIEKIFQQTINAVLFGHPVKVFPTEDQLCHLVQHILHHQFALSLKSYIDIALLLKAKKQNISREKLDKSAIDWKTGEAVPFILKMVTDLFGLEDIPRELIENSADRKTEQKAITAIFELPLATSRHHEINLLKYKEASVAGKIKIIFSRIFMPQSFMQLHYPFAKNILLLPAAWLLRAVSLIKSSGSEITHTQSSAANLSNASTRAEIIKELTGKKF